MQRKISYCLVLENDIYFFLFIFFIEPESSEYGYSMSNPKDHEAGYDSYQTGICFLALADYMNIKPCDIKSKKMDILNK